MITVSTSFHRCTERERYRQVFFLNLYIPYSSLNLNSLKSIQKGDLLFTFSDNVYLDDICVESVLNGLFIPNNFDNNERVFLQNIVFRGIAASSVEYSEDKFTSVTLQVTGISYTINTGDEIIENGDFVFFSLPVVDKGSRGNTMSDRKVFVLRAYKGDVNQKNRVIGKSMCTSYPGEPLTILLTPGNGLL